MEAIYQTCAPHMPAAEDVANANDDTMRAFDTCVQGELDGKSEQVLSMKAHLGRGKESLPHQKRSKSRQLLADYLEQRFDQKVRGKTSGSPGNRVINHSDFFHFYHSQLSKITTLVINSYCTKLDKDFNWNPSPTPQQKSDLLDLLKDPEQAKDFFTGCAGRISTACHTPPSKTKPKQRQQACQTMETLRRINRAITRNSQILKAMPCQGDTKNRNPNLCNAGLRLELFASHGIDQALELYNPNLKGQSIDDLTSLTASEFQQHVTKKTTEACNPPGEKCLKYLEVVDVAGTDQQSQGEEDKNILGKFQIKTLIVKRQIAGDDHNDPGYTQKAMAREIASEGGSDEVIKAIEAKSEVEIQQLRATMKKRYERERTASLRGLAARMTAKGSHAKPGSAQGIIDSIKQQNKGLGQLLFFNNIITGYLEITNQEGKFLGRNIASFKREIQVADRNSLEGLSKEYIQQLNHSLKQLIKDDPTAQSQADNPGLTPEQIHQKILQDPKAYGISTDNNPDQNNPANSTQ